MHIVLITKIPVSNWLKYFARRIGILGTGDEYNILNFKVIISR